jgi:hypothetical protein
MDVVVLQHGDHAKIEITLSLAEFNRLDGAGRQQRKTFEDFDMPATEVALRGAMAGLIKGSAD